MNILTKAGNLAERDFDLLSKNRGNLFGVTLTTDNDESSFFWEPNAAPPQERIENLWKAKHHGIKTWVSFEPVVDPVAVLKLISDTHEFVDLYMIGKLNNHSFAKTIDWQKFLGKVEDVLNFHNCRYIIKKDLLKAAGR